jgi:hypothetical protein
VHACAKRGSAQHGEESVSRVAGARAARLRRARSARVGRGLEGAREGGSGGHLCELRPQRRHLALQPVALLLDLRDLELERADLLEQVEHLLLARPVLEAAATPVAVLFDALVVARAVHAHIRPGVRPAYGHEVLAAELRVVAEPAQVHVRRHGQQMREEQRRVGVGRARQRRH